MSGRIAPAFDRRTLSRAVSRAAHADVTAVLAQAPDLCHPAPRIGITGVPGVGKSSLVARLARRRIHARAPIAIVAIDPSSPETSGAVLGDRVRMDGIADDPRFFIRSLSSGGAHDGLCDNLPEVLAVLDRGGFAEILMETVGVGQAEYGVRELADVEVLVVMPGLGDTIQAMKAGILETADILVINKSDLPGAERTEVELRSVLTCRSGPMPPLIQVRHDEDDGVERLNEAIDRQLAIVQETPGAAVSRRRQANRYRLRAVATRALIQALDALPESRFDESMGELFVEVLARMK